MFNPRSRRTRRTSKAARHARLRVEELEQRNLLSIFTPAQVRHAYGFDQIKFGTVAGTGAGQTIAIIDAYDAPKIAADLHTFDATFGLADPPKFTKINQNGGTSLPVGNPDWATETSLDVEWAHAIAPGANLLLVEANSDSLGDLLTAVNFARQQRGVVAVSMSWGAGEFSGETSYDSYFTTPAGHLDNNGLAGGVTFLASSGDSGAWYGPEWPSVSPNVVSVGGTSLALTAAGAYGGETGWDGSGGGYSWFEREPSYQSHAQGSGWRTNPDVAYNADPNTAVYVYDSYPQTDGSSGWFQVGGTSAAAPQWAALVAIADQGRALANKGSLDGRSQALPMIYAMPGSDFHDVVSGNNGYAATAGYDLVTGRGSPVAPLVVQYLVTGSNTTATKTATAPTTTNWRARTGVEANPARPPEPAGMAPATAAGGPGQAVTVPLSVLGLTVNGNTTAAIVTPPAAAPPAPALILPAAAASTGPEGPDNGEEVHWVDPAASDSAAGDPGDEVLAGWIKQIGAEEKMDSQ